MENAYVGGVMFERSSRRFQRPVLALFASLALHVAVVIPFLVRPPENEVPAPLEESVTVEIVPDPEPPEPLPEKAPETAEAPKPPPAPAETPSAAIPPPSDGGKPETQKPASLPPAEASDTTAASAMPQPFEASAEDEPDTPPDPEDPPAPAGEAPAPEDAAAAKDAVASPHEQASQRETATATAEAGPQSASPVSPLPPAERSGGSEALTPNTPEARPDLPDILPGEDSPGQGETVAPLQPDASPDAVLPDASQTAGLAQGAGSGDKPLDTRASGEASSVGGPPAIGEEAPITPSEQALFVPAKPVVPQTKPEPEEEPVPAPKPAKTLYAKDILSDPRVRGALGKLPPEKRIVQMCVIEASEQARRSVAGLRPDLLKGFGRNGGRITGPHLSARGGAVRSRGEWREITFECTVNSAFDAITAFRFAIGGTVPRSAWAGRGLSAD